MSTQFRAVEIPPGVVSKPTKQMRSSNWSQVNLMRWVEGELKPVGGQTIKQWLQDPIHPIIGGYGEANYSAGVYSNPAAPTTIVTTFASRCKMIHSWHDLSGNHHVAYVCEQNVYVDLKSEGTLYEITPAGGWPAPPSPGAGGYGDLTYSTDTYGTPRAHGIFQAETILPNVWSVDNFGAILLVMNSVTGELLQWDPASTPGTLLTRVPATAGGSGGYAPKGRCFVVTQERFVVIFGMYADGTSAVDTIGRRFGWCDQENFKAWDFSNVTSQAGFLDIEPASPIMTAIAGRYGTLFWTATKAYVSRFISLPYVYNYIELADGTTPWSPDSAAATSSLMLWMSEQGAFSFDGTSILPVECKVRAWINDDIDRVNVREQACAVHVGDFDEFWWFFPQDNQPYNTRCVIYNYKEGWWSQGQMSRSAGITSNYLAYPLMADGQVVFQHEFGNYYNNAALPWAETFDLNLGDGARLTTVKQMLPDVRPVNGSLASVIGNLRYSLFYRNSRGLGTAEQQSPKVAMRPDGYVDFRTTGRDIRLRIEVASSEVQPFTLGQTLVDSVSRGDR